MGWADTLALMRVHYDTDVAVELGRNIMELIQSTSHAESRKLAQLKGACPAFEGRLYW